MKKFNFSCEFYCLTAAAKLLLEIIIMSTTKIGDNATNRSGHPEMFCENGVLKIFAKSTANHLYQSLFLIKFQAWGLQLYLKGDSGTGVL